MAAKFLFCTRVIRALLMIAPVLSVTAFGQSIRLTTAQDSSTKFPQIAVEGPLGSSGIIEVSTDLNGSRWFSLRSFSLTESPYVFLDQQSGAGPRFYRVKETATAPVSLPDLALSENSVFGAGEGFDSVQFAPNGTLGFIFWRNRDLVIRERNSSANWSEKVIASDGNVFNLIPTLQYPIFQPSVVLLYDSNSAPHVFRLSGGNVLHYTHSNGVWSRAETVEIRGASSPTKLVAAIGPGNVFHLGAVGNGGNLVYATTKSGQWQWITVTSIGADPFWIPGSYARRWFSMAVDSRNFAHIVYRPAFTMNKPEGYPLAYTELAYASNGSGRWVTSTVRKPDDSSGEVGSGMSIAMGANDLPSIASWYNERGPGGSAQWSRLQYYQMNANGTWARSEVISRPDAYIAGDDEKGAGVQPYLRFDSRGQPHIVFLDHASEHFPYQNEYAGNVRHAWWNGSRWMIETLYRQDKPLQAQFVFPAFALSGSEIALTGVERLTQWNTSVNPQVAASTYRFRFLSKPLP